MQSLQKIRLRRTKKKDIPAIVELHARCYPDEPRWSESQLEKHIEVFNQGQICVFEGESLIAASSSMIADLDLLSGKIRWSDITAAGTLATHNPDGRVLFGVELLVDPDYAHLSPEQRIFDRRKQIVEQFNLSSVLSGSRLPGYGEHKAEYSVEEYVSRVKKNLLHDPVLSSLLENDFTVRRILPDFYDSGSDQAWIFAEWSNLAYKPANDKSYRASAPVRICTVQYKMRSVKNFEEFAKYCEYFVDVGAAYNSDFVLFPELLTLQLLSFMEDSQAGHSARQLSEFTDQYIELFTDLAVRYNTNIIGGSHFVFENDDLLNCSYLFRRDASFDRQDKIHITPSEKSWWGVTGGNELKVFDTDRGKISIQICYDIEFPELSRRAVEQGAQIIFVPFCTDQQTGYYRVRYCAQARCIENQVYVALAGTVGNLPQVENMDIQFAQSAILTPSDFAFARDGIAAECTPNSEMVLVHDVDLEVLRKARYNGSTRNWLDRRTDLYQVAWK